MCTSSCKTDAFTLFERLGQRLEAHPGQLMRAAVDLAKAWSTDRYLRRLNATMIVADGLRSLTITGDGNVIEAADGLVAIGSGGSYALAAARAFMEAVPKPACGCPQAPGTWRRRT